MKLILSFSHLEALPLLYQSKVFHFQEIGAFNDLCRLIPRAGFNCIRHLHFDVRHPKTWNRSPLPQYLTKFQADQWNRACGLISQMASLQNLFVNLVAVGPVQAIESERAEDTFSMIIEFLTPLLVVRQESLCKFFIKLPCEAHRLAEPSKLVIEGAKFNLLGSDQTFPKMN